MPSLPPYKEQELMYALHCREQKAFAQLHDQSVIALCYFVERITADKAAAEDIATDSFIKTFERVDDFPTLNRLKSFLYTTANNAAIDYVKAQKRHAASHNEIQYLSARTEEDVELQFIRAEALQAIYDEINRLPVQSRTVIRLALLEGKTLDEISAETNMAYKTVQHYKTQGMKLLRVAILKNRLLPVVVISAALRIITDHIK